MARISFLVGLLPIIFAVLCLHATGCNGLQLSKTELEFKIDEFVNEMLRCRKFTAVNVAVVHGNDTLVSKGYGVVDMETNTTVTNKTLFGIASLSKAFTAKLLGVVMDKSPEDYNWDTKVRSILGGDFYLYDAERTNEATLRDLLTHRMGYESYNNIRHQSGLDRQTLAHKMRFLKPTLPFRGQFKYSNILYGLLTHVTEVIGGDTWENLMRQHIFEPLGMTSSDFTHEVDLNRPDLIKTYQVDFDGSLRLVSPEYHSYWGKIGGSGSIISNAEDMPHWIKTLLNHGINENGDQVIPSDVIKEAHSRFISIMETESDRAFIQPQSPVTYSHFEYGLAWRIGYYRGWRTVLHTGTSMGYLAQLTLIPDLNLGIHSSFSGDDPGHTGRRLLHIYVMDLLMGESPWLNVTSACEFKQTSPYRSDKGNNPSRRKKLLDNDLYIGVFGSFAFGNISFYVNETTRDLMMAYGDLGIWELSPLPEEHSFEKIGLDHVWLWSFGTITFSHSDGADTEGPMDTVSIPGLSSAEDPVFIRGLTMDEAPPPPLLECDSSTSKGIVSTKSQIYWIIIFITVLIVKK